MPFKSKAQMRLFARDPKLQKWFKEWYDSTPNPESLPEKVGTDMSLNKEAIAKAAIASLLGSEGVAAAIYEALAKAKEKNNKKVDEIETAPSVKEMFRRMGKDKEVEELEFNNELNSW